MAGIRKRGSNYQISVFIGETPDGKLLYERTTFKPTENAPSKQKKEVEAFARDFEDKVLNGRYYTGDKMTFNDVVNEWKEDRSFLDLTINVREGYEGILQSRIVPSVGTLLVGKISPIHFQKLFDGMISEGLSPATVRRTFTVANSVMSYAYRMSIIEQNPLDRVRLPKMDTDTDIHVFSIEQTKSFLASLEEGFNVRRKGHKRTLAKTGEEYTVPDYDYHVDIPLMWRVYFNIAIYSAFRRGEMIALTWEDVDFTNETISINKAISKTKAKGQIVKDPKTAHGKREIKLPHTCFVMLKEWRKQELELAFRVGSKWEGVRDDFNKNPIFIQCEKNIGKRMDVDSPSGKFKEILKMYNENVADEKDKLPELHLHDLRHVSASLLLSQGCDIETVSRRLGHSKASVTLDVYGHMIQGMDETASETLGELLAN